MDITKIGYVLWFLATLLMMLHNAEATHARALSEGMGDGRAYIEAVLNVAVVEATGFYFLWASGKSESEEQKTVARWGVIASVGLGVLLNLLGGVKGTEGILGVTSRLSNGIALALIARWHWVGHTTKAALAQALADLAAANKRAAELEAGLRGALASAQAAAAEYRTEMDGKLDTLRVEYEAKLLEAGLRGNDTGKRTLTSTERSRLHRERKRALAELGGEA